MNGFVQTARYSFPIWKSRSKKDNPMRGTLMTHADCLFYNIYGISESTGFISVSLGHHKNLPPVFFKGKKQKHAEDACGQEFACAYGDKGEPDRTDAVGRF